jgi:hypothetical protein
MRITKIRSWKDFGEYCLDQIAHAAITLATMGWFASTPREITAGAAIMLTIREIEQARETVEEWWAAKKLYHHDTDGLRFRVLWRDLLVDLHLPDRIGDVVFGTLLARGAWIAIHTMLS